jgi:hypothetical protein
VEVKIGIQSVPRELVLETNDSPQDVQNALAEALSGGTVLALRDDKGGIVLVPAEKIAYVELGGPAARRVGFGQFG